MANDASSALEALFQRKCPHCATAIPRKAAGGRDKRFCDATCANRWKAERQKALRPTRKCEHCSIEFQRRGMGNGKDALRFCSRDCSFANQKARVKRDPAKTPSPDRECRTCGGVFSHPRGGIAYCSATCRPSYVSPALKVTRPCEGCGVTVVGTKAKRWCKTCLRKRGRNTTRRLRKHRQRAARFGVAYEPINVMRLFDRDGWRCQVCGVKTPKAKRGTFDVNAPEMDHRIPMAMGGGHVWDNVQTCCRSCNINKGAHTVVGQMQLFPRH